MPAECLLAEDPWRYIVELIRETARNSPQNQLAHLGGGRIFEEPVVGFAAGDDPIFAQYKEDIGAFHLTPREALQQFARLSRRPGDFERVNVIAWALPVAESTLGTMQGPREVPTVHWAHTQTFGAMFNNTLRSTVVRHLLDHGHTTVAPLQLPSYEVYEQGPGGRAASWSEKHVAYATGLGTFGLNCGLITRRGDAVFLGSVVTALPLEASGREYGSTTAHCPFYAGRGCTECMDRCPAGAITDEGLDKGKCMRYVEQRVYPLKETYGLESVGCALCFTGVRCERQIPTQEAGGSRA